MLVLAITLALPIVQTKIAKYVTESLNSDFKTDITVDRVAINIFGGVKLIIPSNWELKSDITAVLGGIDDKRNVPTQAMSSEKKVVLTGFVMFGGVDIKSF